MEPIKTETSINFIERELIKRQKLNILYWQPDSFIKVMASDRDLTKLANTISEYALKSDKFPLYVLLNVQFDIKDNKHSEMIIITKHHEKFSVSFFDSNGLLSEKFRPDINVRKILEKVASNLDTEYYELMENKLSINTVGRGNCDAFCLWLIYSNRESSNKTEVLEVFNNFYQEIKNSNLKDYILEMNKNITNLSKIRGAGSSKK